MNRLKSVNMKKMLPQRVAVLYSDDDPRYFKTKEEQATVAGAYEDALRFEPYLKKLKIKGVYIKADDMVTKKILDAKVDMAINLVTTVRGSDYLGATIPAMLDLLGIPYTGTDHVGFTLGSNKYILHSLLAEHGIPVPRFQLFDSVNKKLDKNLKYPLILKLNEEHSNLEITIDSVVETEEKLRKRLDYLMKTYFQDVLVSEFIEGREFAAFLVDLEERRVYVKERLFYTPHLNSKYKFMDYKLAWQTNVDEYKSWLRHEKYSDPVLSNYVQKAFDVCRINQYGKFDVRMDKDGDYYFIDANANCYFAPPDYENDSDITRTLEMYGIPFERFLEGLLIKTMSRFG